MKKVILLLLLAIFISSCGNKQSKATHAQAETPQSDSLTPAPQCDDTIPVTRYSGIYIFGDSTTRQGAPKGEAYFYPYDDTTLLCYIYVNIGAPAYNSGSIDGHIAVHNGKATYRAYLGMTENDCVLHFEFKGDTLTVVQEGYENCDCGFGNHVFLDDTFVRTTPDIPQYFVTIANDTVYFSQLKEQEQEKYKTCPKIDSRFISYFPDLALGEGHNRGKQLRPEIINEFLPDLSDSLYIKEEFYAVGKIIGYRNMDLFVLDREQEREDEDYYGNHINHERLLLLFDKAGFPVQSTNEYSEYSEYYSNEKYTRTTIAMASHYYGEGGEIHFSSFFDRDTTLISHEHVSASESATGYQTAIISDKEWRWQISREGKEEIVEITKIKYSSPFFERSFLVKQNWDTLPDTSSDTKLIRLFPTEILPYTLYSDDDFKLNEEIELRFYISKKGDYIFTTFELVDDNGEVIDRYIVGRNHDEPPTTKVTPVESKRKCPIIMETSDGEIYVKPGEKHISFL